jgi:hypothetical protein
LSSIKATKDLLEKRGDIYSDRPAIPFYEMYLIHLITSTFLLIWYRMEFEWALPLARYAEQWRLGRKLLDRGLGAGAASAYRPLQQAKGRVLLTRLLTNPQDWEAHLELSALFLRNHLGLLIIDE